MGVISYREALNQAMREEMERDETVFIMGEEVGHYNGAYKVTQGLLQRFSERRVIDAPIAEMGFAGVGIGAAMVGLRPIIEFMTFNFSLVAIDQIVNNAAKIYQMSGGQFNVPMVFRGPGGPAVQVSSQHSQSLESFYAHVPGLKVVMPSTAYDAKGLLKTAIRDDNPVVIFEHKISYRKVKGPVPADDYVIPLGVADVKRPGRDITIIATSSMVQTALAGAKLLEEVGIDAEVVDPRTMWPLDEATLINSVKKTSRCIVMDEGYGRYGVSAELAATVAQGAFYDLDAPVTRLCAMHVPIPFSPSLEDTTVPNERDVVALAQKLCKRT
jgi:pyruvate/2-oxoglutarate/acetoin dehydrogenase E1 component